MSRFNDNAPVKNTCPIIDDVIRYIESFREELGNEENDIDFHFALGVMEDIRSANSELRDWGNSLYDDLHHVEKERDNLIDELDDSQSELEKANTKIEELEDFITELQEQIN
jgi:chromosome segregation ATPase